MDEMDPQLTAFLYAIGTIGNETINNWRVNTFQNILTQSVVEKINIKFRKNIFQHSYCPPPVRVPFPIKVNVTNLLAVTLIMAFTEYKFLLLCQSDKMIDESIIQILSRISSYFENAQILHNKNKQISFPNESSIIAFFHFQLSRALNNNETIKKQPGTAIIMYSILHSMDFITDDTKYYKKNAIKPYLIEDIVDIAIHRLNFATSVDTKEIESNIFGKLTYETACKILDGTFDENDEQKEEEHQEMERLTQHELELKEDDESEIQTQEHQNEINHLIKVGYKYTSILKVYKAKNEFLKDKNEAQRIFWLAAFLDE